MKLTRHIFCIVLSIAAIITVHAQAPMYQFTSYSGSGTPSGGYLPFNGDGGAHKGRKWQTIYYPANFPGMPRGVVTKVYIRTHIPIVQDSFAYYNDLRISLGYTNDSMFHHAGGVDTFKANLKTLAYGSTRLTAVNKTGAWIGLGLDANAPDDYFEYNPTKNFVVEIYQRFSYPNAGFNLMASTNALPNKPQTFGGIGDSASAFQGASPYIMDLGIDVDFSPLSIKQTLTTTDLQLYPNPAKSEVQLSFTASKKVSTILITLYDASGHKVFYNNYSPTASQFKTSLDVHSLPKGQYFLKLEAEQRAMMRPLLIQ